jgi:hypothetical protein
VMVTFGPAPDRHIVRGDEHAGGHAMTTGRLRPPARPVRFSCRPVRIPRRPVPSAARCAGVRGDLLVVHLGGGPPSDPAVPHPAPQPSGPSLLPPALEVLGLPRPLAPFSSLCFPGSPAPPALPPPPRAPAPPGPLPRYPSHAVWLWPEPITSLSADKARISRVPSAGRFGG